MANDRTLGYILNTGAATGEQTQFQQLVTIDGPTAGTFMDSCIGDQGLYFLVKDTVPEPGKYGIWVLPQPDNQTNVKYEQAPKMTYRWRSKKFVMAGRTTWGAAKVVHSKGCVRLRIIVDGCCRHEEQVKDCGPFRLPSQIAGVTCELELEGTARVTELHVASSLQELLRNG